VLPWTPSPTSDDPVTRVYVDKELGGEGFTYELQSGKTGTVHVEQVLEYNRDPNYLRDLMLYKLTVEAQRRIADSPLSKREIIRRLGTSATQLYRLLDQTNYKKSLDQLVSLLQLWSATLIWWYGRSPRNSGRLLRQFTSQSSGEG
jgi:hypothetical protein